MSGREILHVRMEKKDYSQSCTRDAGYKRCKYQGNRSAMRQNRKITRAV